VRPTAIESFTDVLQQRLIQREEKGLLRTLQLVDTKIDFSSNDYLGFSQTSRNPEIESLPLGATGSRSITGNSPQAETAEKMVAKFHGFESSLIFNSGYCANLGLFSTLGSRGDTYISDEYIHASIIDGMRLSHADRMRFKHNDLFDLEKKLKVVKGRKFVAVESVYSMDGDMAPLKKIADLCAKYKALLIVDEAHATGVFGERGEGLVASLNLQKHAFACIYTFGKALGLHGAAVTGNNILREYLINNSRSFIFTTALPPVAYKYISIAYENLSYANRVQLHDLVKYFKRQTSELKKFDFIVSSTPVQGLLIGDNFKARRLASYLQEKGIFVKPILSPTVPAGLERIRICLHSFNTKEETDYLFQCLKKYEL
jgi:8-amino-7-oxononanoate synthase